MYFRNEIDSESVELAIIVAINVDPNIYPETLSGELDAWIARRKNDLAPEDDAVRKAARDMLRNGRYKPTGRGKPASEYLLRAAQEDGERPFPRINALVDSNNLVSLQFVLPASLWDIDLAGTDQYTFGLGKPGESYVFNETGQEIDLEDLVVGYAESTHENAVPIVNPIKDSLRTKTIPETRNIAAAIYCPYPFFERVRVETMSSRFASLLDSCGSEVTVHTAIVQPGESVTIEV